jgi:hypothetical protein
MIRLLYLRERATDTRQMKGWMGCKAVFDIVAKKTLPARTQYRTLAFQLTVTFLAHNI